MTRILQLVSNASYYVLQYRAEDSILASKVLGGVKFANEVKWRDSLHLY
jgi:hypothetical protein